MVVCLFTDFGAADIYVGQVKCALHEVAPAVPVIDLLHDAPAYNIRASAHLLAALAGRTPARCVIAAVVDPGVGGEREPVTVAVDGRWVVGPDNGLISVLAARAQSANVYPILWRPARLSASFHGRDLFAPCAGMLAAGRLGTDETPLRGGLDVDFGSADLSEIVYIDHYGNAMTGLRAGEIPHDAGFAVNGCVLSHATVFSAVAAGALFWYENSLGLVEFTANSASAAALLGLTVGTAIEQID